MYTRSQRHTRPGDQSVLVVDDDDEMRETLAEQLAIHGRFKVSVAASFAEALACTTQQGNLFEAFLLDIALPDGDGRDLCARLRASGVTAPIIMLTGWNKESDVVRGLQAGANDHVAKPFRLLELLARLRAHIRVHRTAENAAFRIGAYIFRPSAKRLEGQDRTRHVFLTAKEVAILKVLCRADGQTVPRPRLLYEVWGYSDQINTHTLEAHIYRLRQKIEPDKRFAQFLTSDRVGYRLDRSGPAPSHPPAISEFSTGAVSA